VIEAFGSDVEVAEAYGQVRDRFSTILSQLVEELPKIQQVVKEPRWVPKGPVAVRMMDAVWPHRGSFVTPMAAVAGSVADEMAQALTRGRDLRRAYINNSGDIAIYLAPGEKLRLGIVGELDKPGIDATAEIDHASPIRGVATSGWRGRSWSFGIADAVTVVAVSAAIADVAATLIANAVNADHQSIERRPASEMDDQTDLGNRLVTVSVGNLDKTTVDAALDAGHKAASGMLRDGLIVAAAILLKGNFRYVGDVPGATAPIKNLK
tara:strand:- start:2902 stop:3699 length:798 start_codon:yes stop_codon:yes gene_type:complete